MTKALSILVADDEDSIRVLLDQILKTDGHKVTLVGSATEAFAAMKEQTFDLVITDILMPDGDGLDLIAGVKKLQPGARILAISGGGRYVESEDCLRMARGLGAHAALVKPFNRDQLHSGIASAMAPPQATLW